jgi:neutral ceramidase
MLKIGIAEADITPDQPMRLAGMLNPPEAQGTQWPLHARVFVFSNDERQIALVVLDNLLLATPLIPEFRITVTLNTPISPEDVMIACTHTHRAPFAAALMDEEVNFDYVDWMREQTAEAMRQAVASLQPAVYRVGHIAAPGWTFNRRQMYRSARYGEQVGTQGPQDIPEFIRNEGPEDEELKILQFVDMEDRCLGGLVNFACHTTVMGGEPVYSADYAGPLTELLSKQFGGIFGFLQGAAGNLWAIDTRHSSTLLDKDYMGPDHALRMGKALAEKANEALRTSGIQKKERLGMARMVLSIPQRKVTREQVELAQWYLEKAPEDLDQQAFTRQIYGHDFTFFHNDPLVQKWFARETIAMWEWQRRMGTRELIEAVEVQAFLLGDVALVGLPSEIFTEFGLKIKAESPFPETFVAELVNGWHGYIPTQEAFQHGGYETRLGYTSRLVPEAGDRMVEAVLTMLQALRA